MCACTQVGWLRFCLWFYLIFYLTAVNFFKMLALIRFLIFLTFRLQRGTYPVMKRFTISSIWFVLCFHIWNKFVKNKLRKWRLRLIFKVCIIKLWVGVFCLNCRHCLRKIFVVGKSYSEIEVQQTICYNDERIFW